MKISKEARKGSKEQFRNSFTNGQLDAAAIKSNVARVAQAKPRHYMGLLKNYQRLIRLEVEKRHAVIESSAALDSATSGQVTKTLAEKYGQDLTTEFKVLPELIGGLRVKIGSTVWDSSIRGRLNALETHFAQV